MDALLETAGVRLMPALRSSIEEGTAGAALLNGLDGTTKTFFEDFARRTAGHAMADSMASVSLTLVAADQQDRPIGVLSATAPGTIIERALDHGYSDVEALTLSVAIGKVHGLAVADEARGQGIASTLMKRAWQVYEQLDYFLLYGSFETERALGSLYTGCGYGVHAAGQGFLLDRIGLPFGVNAGPDQCVFTRWRPRR
ncbi:GNAT family N-acetyltransferase [Streptomyces virginiae]|uniref:GNAT family N-acetyltransferase n=1 Tax=Streptomyces virginiae TaxID=1961 RepID=UPI003655204D